MSTLLFGREISVSVHDQLLDGFDIAFSVERSTSKSANKGSLKIWNLPSSLRDLLTAQKEPVCKISAGYDGALTVLFLGRGRDVVHSREGGDITTAIECYDGASEAKKSWVARSYQAGSLLSEVAAGLFDSLNLTNTQAAKAFARVFFGVRKADHGTVLSGNAYREMGAFCRANGLQFSVQNGVLYVAEIGQAYMSSAVLLSASTGLVDPPPTKNAKGEVSATGLLNPQIAPGGLVQIDSEFVKTLAKVEKVIHSGDTSGDAWYTALEGASV